MVSKIKYYFYAYLEEIFFLYSDPKLKPIVI